jgi:RNA polymerase sigma-54 factor
VIISQQPKDSGIEIATDLAHILQQMSLNAILYREDPMFQVQNQVLRPQVTAHLAQTMSLLQMPATEIRQKIRTELANNPALEIVEDNRCPNCGRVMAAPGPCSVCSQPFDTQLDEPIVFISSPDDFPASFGKNGTGKSPNEVSYDNLAPLKEDLPSYVLRQIAPELEEDERLIAVHILNNLNEDGLLTIPLEEICQFYHVPLSKVTQVADIIKHAEPIGVGASSPQEALLIQLNLLREDSKVPYLAEEAIKAGMKDLSTHSYRNLAKELNTTVENAQQIAEFIRSNLNPYPGRAFWGDFRQPSESQTHAYHQPDIILKEVENSPKRRLMVEIISPYRGTLRINPLFRQAQKQAPDEKSEAWAKDIESASLLIKCLQQRNHTMEQLMTELVKRQSNYILSGDPALMQPQTQADMSELLEVHESTISRAVSDKSVQLPNRKIVPLKMFFDRSLPIRTTLLRLVENEKTPLTDTELAEELSSAGYNIARRTVAKYRAMEGILSSRLRQKV